MVPFPEAAWRNHIVPEEWEACLDSWIALASAYLSVPTSEFARQVKTNETLPAFLTSYAAGLAQSHEVPLSTNLSKSKELRKLCFLLSSRLLELEHPPASLLHWEFLADLSKVYGQNNGGKLATLAWKRHLSSLELSLTSLKSSLIQELEAGLKGDLKEAESRLKRLNHLLHASPQAASFFMAGSDFVDALVSCYKLMNPPLRKVIVSTIYLCLVGLINGEKPNFSSLVDQLYSLKATAEAHKAGPTNVNDSLVAELVTDTPVLKQIQQRIETSGSGSVRAKSILTSLSDYKKVGGGGISRPVRANKKKTSKGKAVDVQGIGHGDIHVHRLSLVSQVQDLFPDLGSGFIVKLLDEYGDNVEVVIGHLLEDSLPPHLAQADRAEEL